ncbi:serine esterase [Ceratobasidium sp. AG-Ba]|nr:serine esterase [Ceratobasidium sp. AG-Ba]
MTTSNVRDVHLLVCVHGMWGVPDHLLSVQRTIRERFPKTTNGTELSTVLVRTNANSFTYDGLDWGAERAVKEVFQAVEEIEKDGSKKVTRFSIVGYSLGGLISRYAIGILYERGFFKTVRPVNFTTFSTPHIGLLRSKGVLARIMFTLIPKMLSRTGRQFYSVDNELWSPDTKQRRPLLAVMTDKDSVFFKALSAFPHITIYGNAVHDLTVPYCTSMIEPHNPFTVLSSKRNRLAIKMDTEYRHVISSFYDVPEGEDVPVHDLAKERQAERDAIPWYNPMKYRGDRPLLPPQLQLEFPLNIILYLLLPLLIPIGIVYATLRVRRQSAESQKRLAELAASPEAELTLGAALRSRTSLAIPADIDPTSPGAMARPKRDEGQGQEEKLEIELKRRSSPESELERGTGTGTLRSRVPSPSPDVRTSTITTEPMAPADPTADPKNLVLRTTPDLSDPSQPIFTPSQLEMISSLNSIPQLRKVRAYFPFVRNAHTVIVARDSGVLPPNDDGVSVLKHWADRFVLD